MNRRKTNIWLINQVGELGSRHLLSKSRTNLQYGKNMCMQYKRYKQVVFGCVHSCPNAIGMA